jgi:hypothetical protein
MTMAFEEMHTRNVPGREESLATSLAYPNKVCCTSPARSAWLLSAMGLMEGLSKQWKIRSESNQKSGVCLSVCLQGVLTERFQLHQQQQQLQLQLRPAGPACACGHEDPL